MKPFLIIAAILTVSTMCFGQDCKSTLMRQVKNASGEIGIYYMEIAVDTARPCKIVVSVDSLEYGLSLSEFTKRISISSAEVESLSALTALPSVQDRDLTIHISPPEVERFRVTSRKFKPKHYADVAVIIDNKLHEMTIEEFRKRIIGVR